MRKILSILCASSLSLAMDVSSLIPASAAPLMTGRVELGSGLEQIQYYRDGYGPRRYYRPYAGRWNGYRGYRYRHDGYRRHNDGWWYPLAALGAGALIGGAIANQGAASRLPQQRQRPCSMVLRPLSVVPRIRQHLPALWRSPATMLFAV